MMKKAGVLLLILGAFLVCWELSGPKIKECGVVLSKETISYMSGKHGRTKNVDDCLYVKFDNGVHERVYTDFHTYYRFNAGDRVCFSRKNARNSAIYGALAISVGIMLLFKWVLDDLFT